MVPVRIVADENIPMVREAFGHLGEVVCYSGRQLSNSHVKEADILLVRSVTPVNRSLLEGTKVRYVGSTTIGFDHIDTEYLQARGIHWSSAPGCNADSVVDYVISAMCRLDGVLEQLFWGATVGIVGMGNVGAQLYRRLNLLGIKCVAYDPLIEQSRYPVLTGLDTVLAADIICLHTPLTRSGDYPSYHLLNEENLQALKPGTVLINAGRGAVVDGEALLQLLKVRDDLCVVLDVWENEPDIDINLLKRVDLATPHIAGYSYDGKLAGTDMIYRDCCRFLQVEPQVIVQAPLIEEPIRVRTGQPVSDLIREVVLIAYDVAADDQRLRGALLHSDGEEKATAFDRLRKEYPQRREFSCYRVDDTRLMPEQARRLLAGLGFSLC